MIFGHEYTLMILLSKIESKRLKHELVDILYYELHAIIRLNLNSRFKLPNYFSIYFFYFHLQTLNNLFPNKNVETAHYLKNQIEMTFIHTL